MSGDSEIRRTKKTIREDKRLENWGKWQKEWQKTQERIATKLNSEPGDLLENYAEGLRHVKEEVEVFEYSQVPTEFDKYRGKPDFYKLPVALSKLHTCCKIRNCTSKNCQCYCCSLEPTYFATQTKKERYILPNIEHIGTPLPIFPDKNILNSTRNIYKRWQCSEYRRRQMSLLAEKIAKIVPHWPDIDNLVVIGSKIISEEERDTFKSDKDEIETIENTEENKTDESQLKKETTMLIEPVRLKLFVNSACLGEDLDEPTCKIRLFFEHNISSRTLSVDYVRFKNRGLCAIRVSWRKINKFRLFRNISDERCDNNAFYFDRRELIILPGRIVELPVWFKTEHPGTYSESWELITRPQVNNDHCSVILVLESYSYFKDMQDNVNQILNYIDVQAKNLLIRNVLYDLVREVEYAQSEVEPCVCGEGQLFETANLINGRPQFLYNETLVGELKQLYDHLKLCDNPWDFSITTLMKIARFNDLRLYAENKMAELTIEKVDEQKEDVEETEKSNAKTEKTKNGKNNKKTKETEPETEVKQIILPKEPYVYTNQMQVCSVLEKMDTPVIINLDRDKYFACNSVLTTYFVKMCHLLLDLEDEKNIIKNNTYSYPEFRLVSIEQLPERQIYERFESHYVPVNFDFEIYQFEVKRKPKNLREIDADDIETIYTTYFNTSIVNKEVEAKGKKEQSKSASKEKAEKNVGKGINKDKENPEVVKQESVRSFDPYIEQFIFTPQNEEVEMNVVTKSNTKLSRKDEDDYYYNQYLIIYSCLRDGVDALVDTVDAFECITSHSTLSELKEQISLEYFEN